MSTEFFETDCTIEHDGKKFTANGAFIVTEQPSGRLVALLYANDKEHILTDWHGSLKIPAVFGREWRSNLSDLRQHVSFEHDGHNFSGVWFNKEWNQLVRAKEHKVNDE